jgi:type IX secretion system PorP/SprF family membrane protein
MSHYFKQLFMKLCYKVLLLIILSHYPFTVHSQDIGFSQFYQQPLLRNPALAGIFTGDMRFVASYRNQWQSVTTPYRTFALSTEARIFKNGLRENDNLTAGLQIIKDVAGTTNFSTTQILPALNYSKFIGGTENSYISAGIMAGLMQRQFDVSKAILNDQLVDGGNGSFTILPSSQQAFTNTDVSFWDFSTGLSFKSTVGDYIDYYLGIGLFHFVNPPPKRLAFITGDEVKLDKKYTANFGLSASSSEDDELILYGDYFKQGGVSSFQVGGMYKFDFSDDEHKAFAFGLLYRLDDAIIPVAQLELSNFIIGTSYDVNISDLAVASQYRGGFELTLSFVGSYKSSDAAAQQRKCPTFGGGHMPKEHYMGY